jgi:hypothetical protein
MVEQWSLGRRYGCWPANVRPRGHPIEPYRQGMFLAHKAELSRANAPVRFRDLCLILPVEPLKAIQSESLSSTI